MSNSSIYHDLVPGDILLTHHSRNLVGQLIDRWTGGKWSHAMMYVGKWDGFHMIIESHYGGVKFTTLEHYIRQGFDIAILRSHLHEDIIKKVILSAEEEIGLGYDYKGLLGYIWSDIIWFIARERKQYDGADKRFCSELIKHHYEHAGGLDLTGKPSANSSPMDFWNSRGLDCVGVYKYGVRI